MSENILELKNIKKYFPIRKGMFSDEKGEVRAVNDISINIKRGETFGIVGESGCGKSTLARTILKLVEPTAGNIVFNNTDITYLKRKEMVKYRKEMSIIFQKPYSALNPRESVRSIISAPLIVHKTSNKQEITERVLELMDLVGLSKNYLDRYPHEFSGGQRQRIVIARAIALNPSLVICDEPVSALDVSIQSQILNLLKDIQEEFNLTYIFVSHDLSVVNFMADRVGVMYLGSIVEQAKSEDLYDDPLHPYTKALLSAIPEPNFDKTKERIILKGDIPNPTDLPKGCKFSTRCSYVMDICHNLEPKLTEISDDHLVACHLYSGGDVI